MQALQVSDCFRNDIVFLDDVDLFPIKLPEVILGEKFPDLPPSEEICEQLVPIINKTLKEENIEQLISLNDLLSAKWLFQDDCPMYIHPIVYLSNFCKCTDDCFEKGTYSCRFAEDK